MADINALSTFVEDKLGQIDFVHINAAISELGPFDQVTEATYDRIFNVNTKGAFFTVQCLAPLVRDGGSIVFTTVTNGQAYPNLSVYSGSKAAWDVTCQSVAVVRLHGRNRQTWAKKGLSTAAERFRYLYSQDELQELAAPIKGLAKEARMVHVLFNNCYGDYAQRNALDLRQLI